MFLRPEPTTNSLFGYLLAVAIERFDVEVHCVLVHGQPLPRDRHGLVRRPAALPGLAPPSRGRRAQRPPRSLGSTLVVVETERRAPRDGRRHPRQDGLRARQRRRRGARPPRGRLARLRDPAGGDRPGRRPGVPEAGQVLPRERTPARGCPPANHEAAGLRAHERPGVRPAPPASGSTSTSASRPSVSPPRAGSSPVQSGPGPWPWTAIPSTPAPRRGRDPHLAARDPEVRLSAIARLHEFRGAYRESLRRLRSGRKAVFPAGTYALRRTMGVRCPRAAPRTLPVSAQADENRRLPVPNTRGRYPQRTERAPCA